MAEPESDVLDALAESFVERQRRGESPRIEDYARAHPALADRIRELFPTLSLVEDSAVHLDDQGAVPPEFPGLEILDSAPGAGGMGKVFRARDTRLDRVVAVKITHAHLDTPAGRAFFEREARAAARLDHPHIVRIHSFDPDHDPPYYVMQYVRGRPLDALPRHSWRDLAAVLEKVARALAYAHAAGIAHRDIKPSNILVDADGEPHITDFGLADHVAPGDEPARGGLRGTPLFLPPDVWRNGAPGGISGDIYALGVTMYLLLSGRPPFAATSTGELRRAVLEQAPPLPQEIDPAIPDPLQRICLQAMERREEDRYRTAALLADDLRRFREGKEVFARPARYLAERRGRLTNHLTDVHLWQRQNLIDTREMDRLSRAPQRLLEADSAWDELSRRFPWETSLLRIGGWLAVLSCVLWLLFYWRQLDRAGRVLALGLPCLLVNAAGWALLRRGSRSNAIPFLSTGCLLLPLLISVVLTEYELLRLPGPPDQELFGVPGSGRSGPSEFAPSNVQLNLCIAGFVAYAAVLLAAARARVFALWLGIGGYLAWAAGLLLVGLVAWLDQHHVARAILTLLPAPLAYLAAASALRRVKPTAATLLHAFFPIPAVVLLTLLARYGAEEWLDTQPAWDATGVQLWLMANGLSFVAAAAMHVRSSRPDARFWGELFLLLVPVSFLVPCHVLLDRPPFFGSIGGHPVSLYELLGLLISIALVVLGTRLRRLTLIGPGLIGLAATLLQSTERHFENALVWPITLASCGGLAMVGGAWLAYLRDRRRAAAGTPSDPGT